MSKVIAIMDKPEECRHCIFLVCEHYTSSQKTIKYYCNLKESNKIYKEIVKEEFCRDEEVHLSNCPLREVPQKKALFKQLPKYDTDTHYEQGYNACIDKIMKGNDAE